MSVYTGDKSHIVFIEDYNVSYRYSFYIDFEQKLIFIADSTHRGVDWIPYKKEDDFYAVALHLIKDQVIRDHNSEIKHLLGIK